MGRTKAINWNDYYTGQQAADILSRNSGKEIAADYLRSLVRDGALSRLKLGHNNMYPKAEVDAYVVGAKGASLLGARRRQKKKTTDKRAGSETHSLPHEL